MSFPLVVPTSSSTSGIARPRYRWRLARELGLFGRGTVTTVASGLEPEHYVISSNFRTDRGAKSRYDGMYLYVTSGDEAGSQRALIDASMDGPYGAFMVDYPYTSPLAAGTSFEISVLPAEEYLGIGGSNDAINRGLDTLTLIDLFDFTVTDNTQIEYSAADFPWLVKAFRRVFAPRTSSTPTTERRREVDRVQFVNDAESPLFVLPHAYNVDDVFTVELTRPASTRVRQGGAWGDSTVGLTSDTDEALYGVADVVKAAKPFALEYLAQTHERGSKGWDELKGEAADARTRAAIAKFFGGYRGPVTQRVGAVGARGWR